MRPREFWGGCRDGERRKVGVSSGLPGSGESQPASVVLRGQRPAAPQSGFRILTWVKGGGVGHVLAEFFPVWGSMEWVCLHWA